MIRVGIVGAGTLGKAHASSLKRIAGTKIVRISDVDLQKSQNLADQFNTMSGADPLDLVTQSDVDAVIITSPTPNHFEQAKAAIEAGKHVYIEMPVVRQPEEAEELLRLSAGKPQVVTVGHTQRFYPEYKQIKNQVGQGAVGKPGMIRLGRRTPHPRGWYSDHQKSGGVIWDAMTHEFDYLQWAFGPIKRVYCKGMFGRKNTKQLDYALATIRMQSGAIAHVESSWCHYGQYLLDVEVAGDKGLIQYNNQDAIPLHLSVLDLNNGSRSYVSESPLTEPAHHKLMVQFIKAIQGDAPNPVTLQEGVAAIRVAQACYDSMATNKPVVLQA